MLVDYLTRKSARTHDHRGRLHRERGPTAVVTARYHHEHHHRLLWWHRQQKELLAVTDVAEMGLKHVAEAQPESYQRARATRTLLP